MTKILIPFLLSFSLSHAALRFEIVEENDGSNFSTYTVIAIDDSSLADQFQLSQKVVQVIREPAGRTSQILSRVQKELSFESLELRSGRPLWIPIRNVWTLEDEKDYANWIQTTASQDFVRGSGLLVDCADAGYLFRWVYAREKRLPIANTLSASGKLFGHFSGSAEWDKLPEHSDWKKDERFKAALRYLFENTFTHVTFGDLYPTEIRPEYIHPGSVYLVKRKVSGHTHTIFEISLKKGYLQSLQGNVPASERIDLMGLALESKEEDVFGRWRWPVLTNGRWSLISAKRMPGYSLEQYEMKKQLLPTQELDAWIYSRLGLMNFESTILFRMISDLQYFLESRVYNTALGSLSCAWFPCNPSSYEYDSYSSPSRDKRILESQSRLFERITKFGGQDAPNVKPVLQAIRERLSYELIPGSGIPLSQWILDQNQLKKLRPEATLSFAKRWGLDERKLSELSMFRVLNNELFIGLQERRWMVDSAWSHCSQDSCDPSHPSLQKLDTVLMDRGFRRLLETLKPFALRPDLRALLEDELRSTFGLLTISYLHISLPELCSDPGNCTFYDLLWKGSGLESARTWSSSPFEHIRQRWGLPKSPAGRLEN